MEMLPASAQLRAWIRRAGLKQREVAGRLGISPAHLVNILTGRRIPSLHLAVRISSMSGIPVTAWTETTTGVPA
jgi:transcriptional regulator with XRE-family HTH domain